MKQHCEPDAKYCGLCNIVGISQVHKIRVMPYGLRWSLDYYEPGGKLSRLKKYSNFICSDQGWKQFLSEMNRIGLEFPIQSDKKTTAHTVVKVCTGNWYVTRVSRDDNGVQVLFLRKATFHECITRQVEVQGARHN